MTLREFIEMLEESIEDAPEGDQIEVVAVTGEGNNIEYYTPVIAIGQCRDGVRRITVA